MPTYDFTSRFLRDLKHLTPEQRRDLERALRRFVADLRRGSFDPALRVHKVGEAIWSLTFSDDGRATFSFGTEVRSGEPHVIWRRVGTHDVYRRP